jgi:endonuclease/exonuclease/phosphatase family metal-dependent hydrolase
MVAELSIATWNCFGMAQGAFDAITARRAPHPARLRHGELRRALKAPHLICVQELMSRDAEAFFDGLGLERVRDANAPSLRPVAMRGSGLGIAGRLPLGDRTSSVFESPRSGWDRLARKGTLHVRVRLPGLELDVLNVHLQAGRDPQAVAIRDLQLGELARRVEQLGSDERTFLVCGDFNVCGLGAKGRAYSRVRSALPGFEDLGEAEDLPTLDPRPDQNALAHLLEPASPCQRIDYIFLRAPRGNGLGVKVRRVARILDRPLNPDGGAPMYASDHFGLMATLEITHPG